MLALSRVWRRSPQLALFRPVLAAKYSKTRSVSNQQEPTIVDQMPAVEGQESTIHDTLTSLGGYGDRLTPAEDNSQPPTAGPGGYPPPSPSNPFRQSINQMLMELPRFRLHCHCAANNTITTFTDPDGNVLSWMSGGRAKFKKSNRGGYEAGYQCAVRIFKDIEAVAKTTTFNIDLFFKGFGQGREAMQKALMTAEGQTVREMVVTLTDRTPIKIGGTRAKKARRL